MCNNKVTIIGLGLIGGSIARALTERAGITDITAINQTMEPVELAVREGTVTRGFTRLNHHVWESDIVFICTPVKHIPMYIDLLSGRVKPGCIITDAGSTKSEIIKHVNAMKSPPCFIGGHPMAGSEKTGFSASMSHLFENAYYILCPSKTTDPYSLRKLQDVVEAIGALPVILDAQEHDRVTGAISHIPDRKSVV